MSSYIVDEKTINRIVYYLGRCWYSRDMYDNCVNDLVKEYGYNLENTEALNQLANALLLLNKRAVNDRYNETNLVQVMKYKEEPTTEIQVVKSLHCLKYQCSEGDVLKSRLYQFLKELISVIEGNIVDKMPEYEKAYWG